MINVPIDQEVRERLRTEQDLTFFVEAGAGTGKTRELVARIVALVGSGAVRMESLVAITFTEAAAAELRDRVRQGLEQAAGDPQPADAQQRYTTAASEVELAAIQTIHAFAATLLRTYPLEAGLPPGFVTLNEIQQSLTFEDRFRAWLYDEVPLQEKPERRAAVRRALGLGLTVERLRELTLALQDHADLLSSETQWSATPPVDAEEVANRWGQKLRELGRLIPLAQKGESDPLVREIRGIEFSAQRMAGARGTEEALVALIGFLARLPKQIGNQEDWRDDTDGKPVPRIKKSFSDARSKIEETVTAHRSVALCNLLPHLRDFTLDSAERRKKLGVATFHDLLVWARDLLRDNPEVRRQAHERFQRIFVDEFQDTDPLQAEIVWLLAGDPDQAAETDWREISLVPGRLFLVGDPKQSIYRFRRADIGLYEQVLSRSEAGRRQVLVQSFRSAEPIVTWVNDHFAREIDQGVPGVQPRYERLEPRSLPELDLPANHGGVHRIGGRTQEKAPQRWLREADEVARVARQAVEQRWRVTSVEQGRVVVSDATYRDIGVLMPTRNNLRRLERALERHGVPYRVESGSLVLHTQEVRDLLSALRAIDDPSDQVALVAALRSPAYACSDVDLLAWVEAGGRLSYLSREATQAPEAEPKPADVEMPAAGEDGSAVDRLSPPGSVAAAFASLRAFHEQRSRRSAAQTIEEFIRERMLAIQAFGHPRPRESWRRLRYVVAQARALASSGEPSLRGLLDWLENLQRRAAYDAESPVPEADENAVRLLTVHGAKGLEFPIAVLTGLGLDRIPPRTVKIVPDFAGGGSAARCGVFQTSNYDDDRDKQLDEAERTRLLYVAATRARDHLVLCLGHSSSNCHAARIVKGLNAAGAALCQEIDLAAAPMVPTSPPSYAAQATPEASDQHQQAEALWSELRRQQSEMLAEDRLCTPSGLAARKGTSAATDDTPSTADEDDEDLEPLEPAVPETLVPALRGRGGSALGRAVHAVLQRVDPRTRAGLDALADAAAAEHAVEPRASEVRDLCQAVLDSAPLKRATRSNRFWREAPVGIEYKGTVLEGFIDLLYEHDDGTLGVVDYKTDQVTRSELAVRAEHYRLQGGAYALAIEQATGKTVSSIELVFAALDEPVRAYYGADVKAAIADVQKLLDVPNPPN